MAKKKRARRSAIVPALVLSTAVAGGLCATPTIVGCDNGGPQLSVAAQGFDLTGSDRPMDLRNPPIGFDVAAWGFDLSRYDLSESDGEIPD
jgi:hypothetical protein